MAGLSRCTQEPANLSTEHLFGETKQSLRLAAVAIGKLKEIHPHKTAAHIAARARVSTRSAEYWLSSHRMMSASALLSILTTEDGGAVLRAVMEAVPEAKRPTWWRKIDDADAMASLEKQQAEIEARMSQLRLKFAQ